MSCIRYASVHIRRRDQTTIHVKRGEADDEIVEERESMKNILSRVLKHSTINLVIFY